MRLFGTPGGTLNKARSTYGFAPPFDLAFGGAAVLTPGPYRVRRTEAFLVGGDGADLWIPGGVRGQVFLEGGDVAEVAE